MKQHNFTQNWFGQKGSENSEFCNFFKIFFLLALRTFQKENDCGTWLFIPNFMFLNYYPRCSQLIRFFETISQMSYKGSIWQIGWTCLPWLNMIKVLQKRQQYIQQIRYGQLFFHIGPRKQRVLRNEYCMPLSHSSVREFNIIIKRNWFILSD